MSGKTAIVTGITTFLGLHIASAFAAAGYRIVGTHYAAPDTLDPLRSARFHRVRPLLSACHQLDITDSAAVEQLVAIESPAYWLHMAGLGKNFASAGYDLDEANRINLLPLEAIYRGMSSVHGSVLAAGSSMEYGTAKCPHSEEAACWPESPYGLSKLAVTLRLRQLAKHYRVPTRVARIYTLFGELDGPNRLVARMFQQLRSGMQMGIAPGVSRDICDVADVATGFLHLAIDCAREPLFDIFNLSRGSPIRLTDFAQIAVDQLAVHPDLVFEDISALRAGEPPGIWGDSGKALARLGWAARPVTEGLLRLAAAPS